MSDDEKRWASDEMVRAWASQPGRSSNRTLARELLNARARVAELEEQVKEAVVRLARVPNMLDRERREGAEAMRERVAEHAERYVRRWSARYLPESIRALPLDDDAREDAGLVCGACGTPMSSSAADAVAYSGFPPAEGLSRPSCCDAAYPANAREGAQGDEG